MMDAQNDSLFPFLHDYLKIYLPKHRKASVNTVRSYRKSLEALLDYAKAQLQLPLGSITFEHLTVDLILSFMEQLKLDTDCEHLLIILGLLRFVRSWITLPNGI